MLMKIAVTGATGFVGAALVASLERNPSFQVLGLCRNVPERALTGISTDKLLGLGSIETADFSDALKNVDVVIHTAARAHISAEEAWKALPEFRRVNVDGTLNLARQAVTAGAKRFIFISSIGVNGGGTDGNAFTEQDVPKPHTPYAQSKLEAEAALHTLCQESGMELVVIRPTLIYAAHAPGNFATLLKVVDKQLPLPFALVKNKRSFIALENVVHFISLCVTHPRAANETFVIADDEYMSTAQLCQTLSKGMSKSSYMLPVPVFLMRWSTKLLGKKAVFDQLCGSLMVDNGKAKAVLDWQPPLAAGAALRQTGQQFISLQQGK